MSDDILKTTTKTALVYGKSNCPNCTSAKLLLEKNNYVIDYVSLDDAEARKEFYAKTQEELGNPVMSVPQIWCNNQYIGGYQALIEYIAVENSVKFDEEF